MRREEMTALDALLAPEKGARYNERQMESVDR
jgi:hypothetical protein